MTRLLVLIKEFVALPQVQAVWAMIYAFITRYKYTLDREIRYFSPRYKKMITVPKGRKSDGATFATDIDSESWWVHDELCLEGKWDDGSPVTAIQAARVISDILWYEGRWFRSVYWAVGTFLWGCKKAKANGWV